MISIPNPATGGPASSIPPAGGMSAPPMPPPAIQGGDAKAKIMALLVQAKALAQKEGIDINSIWAEVSK